MKYVLYLVLTLTAIFFVGCEAKSGQTPNLQNIMNERSKTSEKLVTSQGRSPLRIACIVSQDDQYMKMLLLGMSDAAEKAGVSVTLANVYNKLDKEIELINTYMKSGVDGICIHPVSVELSVPILKKAVENHIKVISSGLKIDDKYNIGYIESDQWELGKKTGEECRMFIEKKLKGKANIAILNYDSLFPEESNTRTAGFKSEVTKLPGVKIITEQEAWLSDMAIPQAKNIIDSNPEVNIIWAANEGGTVGATIAVKNTEKAGKVFIFGTDVSPQLLIMLQDKDNILQAITGQQPYKIGYQSMEQIINDIRYEQTNKNIIIPGVTLSRYNQRGLGSFIKTFNKMIGTN